MKVIDSKILDYLNEILNEVKVSNAEAIKEKFKNGIFLNISESQENEE